jgi:hypothetical protein
LRLPQYRSPYGQARSSRAQSSISSKAARPSVRRCISAANFSAHLTTQLLPIPISQGEAQRQVHLHGLAIKGFSDRTVAARCTPQPPAAAMRSNQPKATIRPTSSVNINHLNRTLPSGCGQVDALYAAWHQISILRSSSALRVFEAGIYAGRGAEALRRQGEVRTRQRAEDGGLERFAAASTVSIGRAACASTPRT